jgi:hypothetical protein
VVLNQLAEVTLVELISEVLPGCKIEARLVESPAKALPILRDEAGDETPGHHRAHEQHPIEQATQQEHDKHPPVGPHGQRRLEGTAFVSRRAVEFKANVGPPGRRRWTAGGGGGSFPSRGTNKRGPGGRMT